MQHPPKKQPGRGKKQFWIVALLTVLALSAALVGGLPVIRQLFPSAPPEYAVTQPTARALASRTAEEIATVTVYPDEQNSYTLHMQNGSLWLERNGSMTPIDQALQTEWLELLTSVSVENTVTEEAVIDQADLEAMGLMQPRCRAVIRLADGTQETMEVGTLVHDGTEYYFRWSGAQGVYLCHSGVMETLATQANLLIPFEQITLYSALLDRLSIRNAAGESVFAFAAGSTASLVEPFVYPVDADTAQTLVTAVQNFRLGAYEAPLTEENRAFYGFDDPLCVLEIMQAAGTVNTIGAEGTLQNVSIPGQTLQLTIGRAEGEFFYTCACQGDVYLISRFLAETLVQADWRKLISRYPASMGEQQLAYVIFETPDATVEVHIERTESVLENNEIKRDAEGNIVYLTHVQVNGEDAPYEQLELLQDSLNAFAAEGVVAENVQLDGQPRWRITLVTEAGDMRVLEGYRLDAFSDAVSVNGVVHHYVYNDAIDVLMTGLV